MRRRHAHCPGERLPLQRSVQVLQGTRSPGVMCCLLQLGCSSSGSLPTCAAECAEAVPWCYIWTSLLSAKRVAALADRLPCAGVLGPGQEAGPAQALPLRQLAHLLLQVHQVAGALLRQVRPRLCQHPKDRAGGAAEGGRPQRNRAARWQGVLPLQECKESYYKLRYWSTARDSHALRATS